MLKTGLIVGIMVQIVLLYRIDIKSMAVILRDYESFLTKKRNIRPPYIPYYVKWVADCYRFFNEPESKRVSADQRKQFLSQMARTHEEWQVKQADTALRGSLWGCT